MTNQKRNGANFNSLGINSVEDVVKTTISRMDNIINTLLMSPLADTEVISKLNVVESNLKTSTKRIVAIIKDMGDSIRDINIALAKLNEKNLMSIIDAGKFSMITSIVMLIKNGKNQYSGVAGIFLAYSSMIEMVARLSEFAKQIKYQKLRKIIKRIPSLVKLMIHSLIDLNEVLAKQSLKDVDVNFNALNAVIGRITAIMMSIRNLAEISTQADIKSIKKTIRSIPSLLRVMLRVINRISKYADKAADAQAKSDTVFNTFNEIIVRVQQSLLLLVDLANIQTANGGAKNMKKAVRSALVSTFGLMWFTFKRFFAISLLAVKFYPLILISSLVMPFYFKVFNKVFTLMSPIIDQLIKLGQNSVATIKGMWGLYFILIGGKVNPGLIDIFSNRKVRFLLRNWTLLLGLLRVMAVMTAVMGLVFLIGNILTYLGGRYIDIWKGLLATRMIFGGSKHLPGKLAVESLFDIIFDAKLTTKSRTARALVGVMRNLMAIMSMVLVIGIELMILGRYHIRIWLGSHAVKSIIKTMNMITFSFRGMRRNALAKNMQICRDFVIIAGSFVLIAVEFSLIGLNLLGVLLAIPAILLMVVGIFAIMKLMDWISRVIKISHMIKSIASITLASVALGLIAATLALVSSRMEEIDYKSILLLILCSVALLGFFALLGLATPMLFAALFGVGMFVLLTLAMNLVALNLLFLSAIDTGSIEQAKVNADVVINTSIYIIKSLFKARKKAKIRRGRALRTFLFLTFTFLSVTAILLTVLVLNQLNKISMDDLTQAENNADKVIDISLKIIQKTARRAPEGEKNKTTGLNKVLGWFFPGIMNVITLICSFAMLAATFVSIGLILLTSKLILSLNDIDMNNMTNAEKNVDIVMDVAFDLIQRVIYGSKKNSQQNTQENAQGNTQQNNQENKRKGLGGLISKLMPGLATVIDAIISFGFVAITLASISLVYFIAKELTYLQKLDIDQKAIEQNVTAVFDVSKIVVKIANSDEYKLKDAKESIKNANSVLTILKKIKKSSKIISDIGEMNGQNQFDKAIDSYVRFIDKVNTAKVENLEKTANMFAKMAEFSKSINGNFEGLANVLNEKIQPLLESVDKSLSGVNKSLEETSNNVSNISAVTGADDMVQISKNEKGDTVKTVDPQSLANTLRGITNSLTSISETMAKINGTITNDIEYGASFKTISVDQPK